MVSAVTFQNGTALFRNKFVRTKGYKREIKAKKILYRGIFGTRASGGWLANLFALNPKNVANTNIIYWAGRLLALWEGGLPHKLEPDSLQTVGEVTVGGVLEKGQPFSAHPRYDANTNRLVSFSCRFALSGTELVLFEFDDKFTLVKKR
jgi:all-trans-8'-apo-beta-carotenal 15,15'-oxygenase